MPVEMQLSRIIISEIHDQQIIYLREVNGERQFPIVIGIFEATSIDRRVKGFQPPRPLTHDLIVSVVEQLDGELDSVMISELREGTYSRGCGCGARANCWRSTPVPPMRSPSP